MDISSQEIEAIVKQVLAGMGGAQTSAAPAAYTAAPGGAAGDRGVFENVDDAVEAAWKAQRDWVANYKIEDRQRIIEAIRRCARAHVEEWCHKIVEETGMGRYEDKVEKHLAVINKTPGPECLTTEAKSGDAGLMLEEYAPFGVICSIAPTTNPTETIINNTISMIAGGNTVVFNVHPRAKRVSADCLQALNTAIIEAGGPANLITMTREPTMENVDKMAANPKIRLMAGTGGMGMVNALLRMSRLDAGTVELCREKLSLKDLTYRAASPLAIPMELQGQTFQVVGEAQAVCDPAWTAEALGNVLKNCMEHTPASGSITVTLWENPIYSQILVEDTGPGIPERFQRSIFQPFFRVDKSRSREYGGVGLGLSLVWEIVKLHGGTVCVENSSEAGTTVAVSLPLR